MKKTALRKSKPYLYGCKLIRGTPLGANISGSGVIVSTKSCQEPGKIINEYTQVALINDIRLVLALTDKLDARQQHSLKAGSQVKLNIRQVIYYLYSGNIRYTVSFGFFIKFV